MWTITMICGEKTTIDDLRSEYPHLCILNEDSRRVHIGDLGNDPKRLAGKNHHLYSGFPCGEEIRASFFVPEPREGFQLYKLYDFDEDEPCEVFGVFVAEGVWKE